MKIQFNEKKTLSTRFMNTLIEKQTRYIALIIFLYLVYFNDCFDNHLDIKKAQVTLLALATQSSSGGCLRGPISFFRGLPRVFNGHDRFLGLSPRLPANRSPCPISPNEFESQCSCSPTDCRPWHNPWNGIRWRWNEPTVTLEVNRK